ncbi:hypothetical protein [Streptantibioticus ferralitis]|uniref:Uncharacterized protein n=1 Tax=Streptantibioticus ferralitis TaxID=236510 RepID=A0ABT5Z4Z0_9ACTN|nr:hypothetical protein [Streptantibioticus ferralitis]MDF2258843.1 hypothetical protein [Streptantibioticus ferralitis]
MATIALNSERRPRSWWSPGDIYLDQADKTGGLLWPVPDELPAA